MVMCSYCTVVGLFYYYYYCLSTSSGTTRNSCMQRCIIWHPRSCMVCVLFFYTRRHPAPRGPFITATDTVDIDSCHICLHTVLFFYIKPVTSSDSRAQQRSSLTFIMFGLTFFFDLLPLLQHAAVTPATAVSLPQTCTVDNVFAHVSSTFNFPLSSLL